MHHQSVCTLLRVHGRRSSALLSTSSYPPLTLTLTPPIVPSTSSLGISKRSFSLQRAIERHNKVAGKRKGAQYARDKKRQGKLDHVFGEGDSETNPPKLLKVANDYAHRSAFGYHDVKMTRQRLKLAIRVRHLIQRSIDHHTIKPLFEESTHTREVKGAALHAAIAEAGGKEPFESLSDGDQSRLVRKHLPPQLVDHLDLKKVGFEIRRVLLNVDSRYAKVMWSVWHEDAREEVERILPTYARNIQNDLARRLKRRWAPMLDFYYDAPAGMKSEKFTQLSEAIGSALKEPEIKMSDEEYKRKYSDLAQQKKRAEEQKQETIKARRPPKFNDKPIDISYAKPFPETVAVDDAQPELDFSELDKELGIEEELDAVDRKEDTDLSHTDGLVEPEKM